MKSKALLILLFLMIFCCIFVFNISYSPLGNGPTYKNHTLKYWLFTCQESERKDAVSVSVIKNIDEVGLKYITACICYYPTQSQMTKESRSIRFLRYLGVKQTPSAALGLCAANVFDILGDSASNSIPMLRDALYASPRKGTRELFPFVALAKMGPLGIANLIEATHDKDVNIRQRAAMAMRFVSTTNLHYVAQCLGNEDTNVVSLIIPLFMVDSNSYRSNVPMLCQMLSSTNDGAVYAATYILGCYGDNAKESLGIMCKNLSHKNENIRNITKNSISNITRQ